MTAMSVPDHAQGQEQNGGLTKALVNLGSAPRLHPSMEAALETLEKAWREVGRTAPPIQLTEHGMLAGGSPVSLL